MVEIGKSAEHPFVMFPGEVFLQWVKASELRCLLKIYNTFCAKKIVKTRYDLSYRWMENRPREKNKWLNDLTLPREWTIKCKILHPALPFHLCLWKIQVSVCNHFESRPSSHRNKVTGKAVLIWLKDCFSFLANIIGMALFSYSCIWKCDLIFFKAHLHEWCAPYEDMLLGTKSPQERQFWQ